MATAVMPLPTRVLLASSHFLRSVFTSVGGWVFLAVIVGGLVALRKWTKTTGRVQWDAFRLRIRSSGRSCGRLRWGDLPGRSAL